MIFRRAGGEGTGQRADLVVVGLANPGPDYAGTRHNVGAEVVEVLASRHGARLERAVGPARSAVVAVGGRRVALAVPETFMNLSGEAVAPLVRRYGWGDPGRLVVVHDELDLPAGRVKVKVGGGLAGHNGLKSVKAHLQSDAFLRVRLGVGKPPGRRSGTDHVLRRPSRAERAELDVAVEEAADAVELLVSAGPEAAMNRYNREPVADD